MAEEKRHRPFSCGSQFGDWQSASQCEGLGAHHYFPDGATVRRVGKKGAGRLLDGREHNEFPEVTR